MFTFSDIHNGIIECNEFFDSSVNCQKNTGLHLLDYPSGNRRDIDYKIFWLEAKGDNNTRYDKKLHDNNYFCYHKELIQGLFKFVQALNIVFTCNLDLSWFLLQV